MVRVPAREAELRRIRAEVRRFVGDAGGREELIADLELVVSELSTNVIQHSGAGEVVIAMRHDDGLWEVDVHHADGLPDLGSVVPPPNSSTSGRGIMVVRALMDDVEIVEESGETLIRCSVRA